MAKYRTTNGIQTGFVPGVGEIVSGIVEAPENWQHGANFEKVVEQSQEQPTVAPAAPAVSQPQVQTGQTTTDPGPALRPQVEQTTSKETA